MEDTQSTGGLPPADHPTVGEIIGEFVGKKVAELRESSPDPALLEAIQGVTAAVRDLAEAVRELQKPRRYEHLVHATGIGQALSYVREGYEVIGSYPMDMRTEDQKRRGGQAGSEGLFVLYVLGLPWTGKLDPLYAARQAALAPTGTQAGSDGIPRITFPTRPITREPQG
jgi:hypothetical protein